MRVAERRLEPVRRELDEEAERVVEVDRVHEATVLDAGVADPPLVQPLHGAVKRRLRERRTQVVDVTRVIETREASGVRSSFVNTVTSRPSPGSK